jgi:hypothetical protein
MSIESQHARGDQGNAVTSHHDKRTYLMGGSLAPMFDLHVQVRVGLPLPQDPEASSHVRWRHCNVGLRDASWSTVAATLDAFTESVSQQRELYDSGRHILSSCQARGCLARISQVHFSNCGFKQCQGHIMASLVTSFVFCTST